MASTTTTAGQLDGVPNSRRGGRRKGAGRKPKGNRPGVPHVRREEFPRNTPVHVTISVKKGVPRLRSRKCRRVVFNSIATAQLRFGMSVVQFSIQANHIHLIVEAFDRRALSRGMKGLAVRIAKRLNRAFDRKGAVFRDRYHAHVLRTYLEVRNAVHYVMNNSRIHAERRGEVWTLKVDPCAGGPCPSTFCEEGYRVAVEPRSYVLWLLWDSLRSRAAPPSTSPLPVPIGVGEPTVRYRIVLPLKPYLVREMVGMVRADHSHRLAA